MPFSGSQMNRLYGYPIAPGPAGDIPDKRAAATVLAYIQAADEWGTANRRLEELRRQGLDEAKRADSEKLADALRRGKPDPGPAQRAAVEREMLELERLVPALLEVARTREAEMFGAVGAPDLHAEVNTRIEAKRKQAVDLLAGVSAAVSDAERLLALSRWLKEPSRNYQRQQGSPTLELVSQVALTIQPPPPVPPVKLGGPDQPPLQPFRNDAVNAPAGRRFPVEATG